jgi:hypothetical protein
MYIKIPYVKEKSKIIYTVDAKNLFLLCLNSGIITWKAMNAITLRLGELTMCHGVGGLAAQSYRDVRTGGTSIYFT